MGAFASRRNHGVEEVDISTGNAYRYPPKSGCYFGSHFIMGGDRFETTQPEAYLFGDNQDLNFLGSRPVPFPYPAPQAHEPTKTLKSLVNIRKDSLRFIRVVEEEPSGEQTENQKVISEEVDDKTDGDYDKVSEHASEHVSENVSEHVSEHVSENEEEASGATAEDPDPQSTNYNIEFTFDTDVKCAITIFYFATEEISNKQAIYRPKDPSMNSETFHYKRGANQVFSQTTHVVDPAKFAEEEWQFNPDKEVIPLVIQCVVEEEEYLGHSHMTFAIVEKGEGGYSIKPLKQKQMVDGLCYLLQEIYGIENKHNDRPPKEDDPEDYGSECVICLVETRDTLILPCRHLCLCNCCADNLRYQASNCPICRSPFRALLQIRAMRKKQSHLPLPSQSTPTDSSDGTATSQEGIPPGYEAVSLIEALNGPSTPTPAGGGNINQRNYPDAIGRTGSSQPTSPEESPVPGRKRLRRKASSSSNRSRRSVQGTSPIEEAKEVKEDLVPSKDVESPGTPEIIMTEIGLDPTKGSPPRSKNIKMPKIRHPVSKRSLEEPDYTGIEPSQYEVLKIVDETTQTQRDPGNEYESLTKDNDATSEGEPRPQTPPIDYDTDKLQSDDVSDLPPEVQFKPAAQTMVLHGPEDGEGDMELNDSTVSPHGVDPLFPGLPVENPDGSGSSYSSTESTKGLLAQTDLDHDKQDDGEDQVLA